MTVAFYMNCVSAHQLPLARDVAARVGSQNFTYVDAGLTGQKMQTVEPPADLNVRPVDTSRDVLETADLVLTGLRDFALMERRAAAGRSTYYYSERWFKPVPLFDLRLFDCVILVCLPGWVRMLVPSYRRMAKRFVAWMKSDPKARCLAIGPWAKQDMRRLGVPSEKVIDWGYFVSPSLHSNIRNSNILNSGILNSNIQTFPKSALRILWVGRMLDWKRVETILRAVSLVRRSGDDIRLTLVGEGPEKPYLERLAAQLCDVGSVDFMLPQPIEKVREIMRAHDVYVLASNAQEGWGAALNEALEEGMACLGTCEAGASAAILPPERLFHAGDARALAELLVKESAGALPSCSIGEWTAAAAAERLVSMVG